MYQLYLANEDNTVGDLVGEDPSLADLITFCYDNWPEFQDYKTACQKWNVASPKPQHPSWEGGTPPFFIKNTNDGEFHVWEVQPASAGFDDGGSISFSRDDDDDDDDDDEDDLSPVVLNKKVSCQRCSSHRVADLGAKCSDLCDYTLGSKERDGYVPNGVGIGGDDYVEFAYCLDCGQIQGTFPLPISNFEKGTRE